jgi:hypothetical protein
MDVGTALIERAREIGRTSAAVVGTGKNVGKTVTTAAMCAALERQGVVVGITSIGRDGESLDVVEAIAKPRLWLCEGTLIATARTLLPAYPALEIVQSVRERNALGSIVIARVRTPGFYEIAGPAGADAVRRVVRELLRCGSSFVLLDGAVDRLAALRDGDDAIIVAAGAASGPTPAHVVEDVRGLVAKLSLPSVDFEKPFLRIAGALSASEAAALSRAGERRQILVRDATRIACSGRLFLSLAGLLDFRCERALRPVAATVASIAPGRLFEPSSFLQAVAEAVQLPTYDVYAQAAA